MKIATYNVWNSKRGMPGREEQICAEIDAVKADVMALQEVRDQAFSEKLLQATGYTYHCFVPHRGDLPQHSIDEGLAIYSQHPIRFSKYIDYALLVVLEHQDNLILVVNVHLPWDSVLAKERCIVRTIEEISTISSDYRFIVGDFNSSETSSVHQYLRGEISLNGTEVSPYWTDLAFVAEEHLGINKALTLDLINNPRWKGESITDNSSRVDCIFIHDCFPKPYPALKAFGCFGQDSWREYGPVCQ